MDYIPIFKIALEKKAFTWHFYYGLKKRKTGFRLKKIKTNPLYDTLENMIAMWHLLKTAIFSIMVATTTEGSLPILEHPAAEAEMLLPE